MSRGDSVQFFYAHLNYYKGRGIIIPASKSFSGCKQISSRLLAYITKVNAIFFFVNRAHANGIFGSKGAELVKFLGMEKDIPIRLHTCGKTLASSGGEKCP